MRGTSVADRLISTGPETTTVLHLGRGGPLAPTLDGRETSFLEWVGATPAPRSGPAGAMHEVAAPTLVTQVRLGVGPSCLFVRLDGRSRRIRINGRASVLDDAAAKARHFGAQLVVRVTVSLIFPNCSRSVHRMALVEPSVYLPRAGHQPPQPAWKRFEAFRDVLPRSDRG